jgi:hypothetical protein
MLPPGFKDKLTRLSQTDLYDILDAVTLEVKRRAGIEGSAMSAIKGKEVEEGMKLILEALSSANIGDILKKKSNP